MYPKTWLSNCIIKQLQMVKKVNDFKLEIPVKTEGRIQNIENKVPGYLKNTPAQQEQPYAAPQIDLPKITFQNFNENNSIQQPPKQSDTVQGQGNNSIIFQLTYFQSYSYLYPQNRFQFQIVPSVDVYAVI